MNKSGNAGSFRLCWPLLIGAYLIGIAHLAVLPPFEGIDETAHYSSIREIASGHTLPFWGKSYMSPEIADYRVHGPMPYYSIVNSASKNEKQITYEEFFADPKLVKHYAERYRVPAPRPSYKSVSGEYNWESFSPPLYYAIMAPFMRLTDGLSFVAQFFWLRFLSYSMAFGGLVIGLRATAQAVLGLPPRLLNTSYLLYPLMAPVFYPEFGRLGNDSLCLLLFGVIWALWLRAKKSDWLNNLALGFCFGLGLLTKAFFWLTLAGFASVYLLRFWKDRGAAAKSAMSILLPALLLGGWWYALQWIELKGGASSFNLSALADKGGFLAAFTANFSPGNLLFQIDLLVSAFVWFDMWSAVYISQIFVLPFVLFLLWAGFAYLRGLKGQPVRAPVWIPFWLLAPFLLAMAARIVICIALGEGWTYGRYLHQLAPALALALAYGLYRLESKGLVRRALITLFLGYTLIFIAGVFWAEASLYAGCAVPENYLYHFPESSGYCLARVNDVAGRLSVFGWPYAAAGIFATGWLSLLLGFVKVRGMPKDAT